MLALGGPSVETTRRHRVEGNVPPLDFDLVVGTNRLIFQWVTEATAKSYRAMKAIGQDPFNFNQTTGTARFLATAFTAGEGNTDLSEYAGRFPGSWTLPVCDASTWGYVTRYRTSSQNLFQIPA